MLLYHMVRPFLSFVLICASAAGAARVPAPPPSPAALAAARALVAELPIEQNFAPSCAMVEQMAAPVFDHWNAAEGIPERPNAGALQHWGLVTIRAEVERLLPAAAASIRERLALDYAARLDPEAIDALRAFYAAGQGRQLAILHVEDSLRIAGLVQQALLDRLAPRFPAFTARAVERARRTREPQPMRVCTPFD
jgi:hypothetical protein